MVACDRTHVNLTLRACSPRDRVQRARDNGRLLPRERPRRLTREFDYRQDAKCAMRRLGEAEFLGHRGSFKTSWRERWKFALRELVDLCRVARRPQAKIDHLRAAWLGPLGALWSAIIGQFSFSAASIISACDRSNSKPRSSFQSSSPGRAAAPRRRRGRARSRAIAVKSSQTQKEVEATIRGRLSLKNRAATDRPPVKSAS